MFHVKFIISCVFHYFLLFKNDDVRSNRAKKIKYTTSRSLDSICTTKKKNTIRWPQFIFYKQKKSYCVYVPSLSIQRSYMVAKRWLKCEKYNEMESEHVIFLLEKNKAIHLIWQRKSPCLGQSGFKDLLTVTGYQRTKCLVFCRGFS